MEVLTHYSWPGNVRELQSVLKRAVLQVSGPVLLPEYLPADLPARRVHATALDDFIDERLQAGSTSLHAEALAFMERVLLTKVLKHTGGNQSQAAKILNITRGTLRSRNSRAWHHDPPGGASGSWRNGRAAGVARQIPSQSPRRLVTSKHTPHAVRGRRMF